MNCEVQQFSDEFPHVLAA